MTSASVSLLRSHRRRGDRPHHFNEAASSCSSTKLEQQCQRTQPLPPGTLKYTSMPCHSGKMPCECLGCLAGSCLEEESAAASALQPPLTPVS